MASEAQDSGVVTIVLGDEFDDDLRARLMKALHALGAVPVGDAQRFIAGSQELEQIDVSIGGRKLHVEAETFIGLSISGPNDLVQRVRVALARPGQG